jgi:hypothetical protein
MRTDGVFTALDLARVRLFLGLLAAEQLGFAIAVLPDWTPGRAAVATAALLIGSVDALVIAWLLGTGRLWALPVALLAAAGALVQAWLSQTDPHEPAFVLIGAFAIVAVGTILGPDLMSWPEGIGKPPTALRPLLSALLIAGFVGPGWAASLSDPTQTSGTGLDVGITCRFTRTGGAAIATARVQFSWARTDLLPAGWSGDSSAHDTVRVVAFRAEKVDQWKADGDSPELPLASGYGYPWTAFEVDADPMDLTVDGSPPRVGLRWFDPFSSRLPSTTLGITWKAVEPGHAYGVTWLLLGDPTDAPPFLIVEYDHQNRVLFQNAVDCGNPSVVYQTRYAEYVP